LRHDFTSLAGCLSRPQGKAKREAEVREPVVEPLRIEFEPFIDEQTRQFIMSGVDGHNIAATGLPDYFPVSLILRGSRGDVLGGLLGQLWGRWLQVTYLWVAETARGAGHGTSLIKEAEAYACARGAVGVTLETYSFQARPFYERLGYEVFGAIKGYPPGHVKFFLRKTLS
jgi:ribosomal protein S18 acetylase RimI-like enzyme